MVLGRRSENHSAFVRPAPLASEDRPETVARAPVAARPSKAPRSASWKSGVLNKPPTIARSLQCRLTTNATASLASQLKPLATIVGEISKKRPWGRCHAQDDSAAPESLLGGVQALPLGATDNKSRGSCSVHGLGSGKGGA